MYSVWGYGGRVVPVDGVALGVASGGVLFFLFGGFVGFLLTCGFGSGPIYLYGLATYVLTHRGGTYLFEGE